MPCGVMGAHALSAAKLTLKLQADHGHECMWCHGWSCAQCCQSAAQFAAQIIMVNACAGVGNLLLLASYCDVKH